MMRAAIKLLAAGALFVYPVAIYFADAYLTPSQLLAGLCLLLAGRILVAAWITEVKRRRYLLVAGLMLAAAVLTLRFLPRLDLDWLRLYPMVFSLAMFALFFGSLFTRMSLVERIARTMQHELPPQGVIYTRRVTWAWCGVLLLNSLVALYTAIGTSIRVWSLYNGIIVYFLFGGVLLGEYLLRTHLKRKWATA